MSGDKDLVSVQQARDLVEAAARAQGVVARFDQAKIDRICEAMARAALSEAERLGGLAVEETGYGIPADKKEKNRFAARDVWDYFRRLRTVGVVSETKDVIEVASPRGVVAAIIPSTNPTSTVIFKCLIAIKSRNAIVLSPHPSAARSINETADVLRAAAVKEGLPADAIGCMKTSTIEGTEALMKHKLTAVILATGGMGLVRAAYSSGKPAFGVGPGNVPVLVERTAIISEAVADILTGTCFDNGTICASEQAVVADAPIAGAVRDEFKAQGAYFLNAAEADQLAKVVATPQRTLNPAVVGKSVDIIAKLAGLSVPPGTRCLIAEVGGVGREYPLSMEKLSPILAFYVEDGLERGAARCNEILHYGGMGHTAGIHTQSREMARAFGIEMPAARVVVNTPTTHGAIGLSTALPPSMTLGCGSWGGNVSSDNISPLHLMDIKRIAFETKPVNAKAKTTGAETERRPAVFASPQTAETPVISRTEIAAIVDRFLANRERSGVEEPTIQPSAEARTNGVATPPAPAAQAPNGGSAAATGRVAKDAPPASAAAGSNGRKAVDFVCEDDVRQAIQRGEKIHINARTIITPAARDMGETNEVFAKA